MSELTPCVPTTLVRCAVRNRAGEGSLRYIELGQFRLWQYMMENRHGLQVTEANIALWVPAADYAAMPEFYNRAGDVESVDQLRLTTYDPTLGIAHHLVRFVPAAEAAAGLQRLMERLPEDRSPEDVEQEHLTGYVIIRQRVDDLDLLQAGLERREH